MPLIRVMSIILLLLVSPAFAKMKVSSYDLNSAIKASSSTSGIRPSSVIATSESGDLQVLGFWFVLQFVNSFINSSSGGGVAYAAHIGGFISGVILILYFNRTYRKKNFKTKNKNIKKGPWEQ